MNFTSQVFKAPKTSPAKPARVKNTKKITSIHNLAKPNDVFQTWAWIWDKFWWKMVQSVRCLQGVCRVADIASVAEPRWVMFAPRASFLRSSHEFMSLFIQPTTYPPTHFWKSSESILEMILLLLTFRLFCYVQHNGCMCSGTISILLWDFPGLWTGGGLLPIKAALIHTAGTNAALTLAGTGRQGRL